MSTILDALKKAKTDQEKNAGAAAGASPAPPPPSPAPPPSPPAAPPPPNKAVSPYQPTSPPMPSRPSPAPENKVNPHAPIPPVSLSDPLGRSVPWLGIVFGLLLAFGAGGTAMFFVFRNIERGGKSEKQPQTSNFNQSNISNVDVAVEGSTGDSQQEAAAAHLSQLQITQTHTAPQSPPRQAPQQSSSAVRTSAPAGTTRRESELSGLSDSTAPTGTGPRELARAPVADPPPRHIAPSPPSPPPPSPMQASPALEEAPVLQETPPPPPSPSPAPPTPTSSPTPVASPTPDDPLAAYADGSRVSAEDLGWRLEGILWDPASPMVIIGGKFLSQGDKYEDFVIAEIRQSEIVVERSGKRLIVRY